MAIEPQFMLLFNAVYMNNVLGIIGMAQDLTVFKDLAIITEMHRTIAYSWSLTCRPKCWIYALFLIK